MAIEISKLQEKSVRLWSGITIVFPLYGFKEKLDVSKLSKEFIGSYSSNGGRICFISEEGVFVIPAFDDVESSLQNAGFTEREFYVPLTNGESYPEESEARKKWEMLLTEYRNAQAI